MYTKVLNYVDFFLLLITWLVNFLPSNISSENGPVSLLSMLFMSDFIKENYKNREEKWIELIGANTKLIDDSSHIITQFAIFKTIKKKIMYLSNIYPMTEIYSLKVSYDNSVFVIYKECYLKTFIYLKVILHRHKR